MSEPANMHRLEAYYLDECRHALLEVALQVGEVLQADGEANCSGQMSAKVKSSHKRETHPIEDPPWGPR